MSNSFELKHHHGALSVPDLEASIRWYQDVLGFEVERRGFLPPVPADVAFLKRGALRLELFQPKDGHPLPPERREPDVDLRTHGTKHVCFAVRDITEAEQAMRRHNVDIVFVKHMPTTSVMFVRDNSGILVEFYQAPEAWNEM